MTIDQIEATLYPMAGSFSGRADKEMTTFTGIIHRDHWQRFLATVLPQLIDPGFRDEDFKRLKDAQLNALVQDLRSNNEEELGQGTAADEHLPRHRLRPRCARHRRGLERDHAGRREAVRAGRCIRSANLTLGASAATCRTRCSQTLRSALATAAGRARKRTRAAVQGTRPSGIEVEILEKDTRATAHLARVADRSHACAPGFRRPVGRASVARRTPDRRRDGCISGIREVRGINYGDYAYIEAFPRGMFQFFPDPNIARQRQIFEIWIRPVVPVNAHMSLRIAIHELDALDSERPQRRGRSRPRATT